MKEYICQSCKQRVVYYNGVAIKDHAVGCSYVKSLQDNFQENVKASERAIKEYYK